MMRFGFKPVILLLSFPQDSLDGEAEVLLDPNSLSQDGTVALSTKSFSENAEFLAYGLSSSGSDWVTINVLRVEDRVVQPDTLSWVRYCDLVPLQFMNGLLLLCTHEYRARVLSVMYSTHLVALER